MTHTPRNNPRITACSMLAAALGSLSAPAVVASTGVLSFLAEETIASSNTSESEEKTRTLRQMSKPISLDVEDQPLEDIINFLMDVTEAQIEPIYLDGIASSGMDPETLLSLRVSNVPAITVLERVLKKAERIEGIGEEYTWQFTDIGSIECGPKTVLNENQRIELYDIADLIMVVPDFDNAPQFNIQSSGGSSGGGSPFSGGGTQIQIESAADRSQRIIDLIQSSVEPDQWANAGGDGASLTVYGTSLVISAPDYIHRQIVGYDFWPARLHTIRAKGDQRWIQVKPDPSMREP
jgi:hypothetical protein